LKTLQGGRCERNTFLESLRNRPQKSRLWFRVEAGVDLSGCKIQKKRLISPHQDIAEPVPAAEAHFVFQD
jgi:hypothetical protein